ncbi:MAG: hypothetical protein RLQ25_03100 [Alphaproteobacteria bacterium]
MTNQKVYDIAAKVNRALEGEPVRDVGVSLSLVLAGFILLLESTDEGISQGVDAIAADAKDAASKLRYMRQ